MPQQLQTVTDQTITELVAQTLATLDMTRPQAEALNHLLGGLRQQIACDFAAIWLVEADNIVLGAAQGTQVINCPPGKLSTALAELQAGANPLVLHDSLDEALAGPAQTCVCTLLTVANMAVGFLAVGRLNADFTAAELDRLETFSRYMAQPVQNIVCMNTRTATQNRDILEARLAALEQMTATLAHQLRNPLMAIRMGVEYFVEEEDNQEGRHRGAELMQESIHRIDRIVENIFYIAQTPGLNVTRAALPAVVERVIESFEPTLTQKDITCTVSVEPTVQPALLDPEQIHKLLVELLSNSINAMPTGGVIKLALGQTESGQIIQIADSGPGIASKHHERIFEPFFTLNDYGTGLGLAIARQIAKRHGGDIAVWSQPETGSTFTITLPALKPGGAGDT